MSVKEKRVDFGRRGRKSRYCYRANACRVVASFAFQRRIRQDVRKYISNSRLYAGNNNVAYYTGTFPNEHYESRNKPRGARNVWILKNVFECVFSVCAQTSRYRNIVNFPYFRSKRLGFCTVTATRRSTRPPRASDDRPRND